MLEFGAIAIVVSIHAPVKGATLALMGVVTGGIAVSIHAPVKGATHRHRLRLGLKSVSIHAPVKGATSAWKSGAVVLRFRSTPP